MHLIFIFLSITLTKTEVIIKNILYAGNDENFKYILDKYLKNNNYSIKFSNHYEDFKTNIINNEYNIALLDDEIIKGKIRVFHNDINILKNRAPIIIITGSRYNSQSILKYDDIDLETVKKPFRLKDLINKFEYLNQKKSSNYESNLKIKIPFIDKTNKTKIIFDGIYKIINNNLNALITGEAGTGKKQIANTINAFRQPNKKIIEINYLDYKNNNFEKLLLNKITKDEFLNLKLFKSTEVSDTILLSDIDIMPINIQKILLENLKLNRDNSSFISKSSRFIATTSINLKQMLSNNNFSNELFYQLSMYNIYTLPLRERKDDIKLLVKEIIAEFNVTFKKEKHLNEDAFDLLEEYIWPGNLTQLKNYLLRCYKFSDASLLIKTSVIKKEIENEFKYANKDYMENWKINFNKFITANIRGYLSNINKMQSGIYYKLIREFERPLIIEMLKFTNNNKLLSAQLLGINRNTLRKKMDDYEIEIIKNTRSDN